MKSNFRSSYKLGLLLAVLPLIILCSKSEKNFERGALLLNSGEISDYKGIEPLLGKDPGTRYHFIKREKTTYRSKFYRIRSRKKITLHPEIKGEVTVYFSIGHFKMTERSGLKVKVSLYSGGDHKILKEFGNFTRVVTFNENVSLAGSDKIVIELEGNTDIFISEPLYLKPTQESPVFLIMADTLRADHLGVYGNKGNISKNITAFSGDCAVFDNCFSTTSWTLPAHMSLFTSKNIYNVGVYTKKLRLADDIPVFMEELSRNRFTLSFNEGIFVKYKYGFFRGFDQYRSRIWRAKVFSRRIFEYTAELLKNRGFNNIFAFLHTYQVHSPFRIHPGLEHSDMIKTKRLTEGFKFPYKLADHQRRYTYRPQTDKKRKDIISFYDAELEYFDHWFGYFINALKESGMYDNSLIIFMSDHGEEFFDHGTWGHGNNLYNETLRIPLLIKFPLNKYRGVRVPQNCSILDVFPTIFDYLKISYKHEIDGISLIPLLNDPVAAKNDRDIESLLIHSGSTEKMAQVPQMLSVINGKYKLIYNFKYSDNMIKFYSEFPLPAYKKYELYNIKEDFSEKIDLSSDPEYSVIFKKLKKKIDLIKKKVFENKVKGVPLEVTNKDMEKLKTLGYL